MVIEDNEKAGDAFDPAIRQLLFWIGAVSCLIRESGEQFRDGVRPPQRRKGRRLRRMTCDYGNRKVSEKTRWKEKKEISRNEERRRVFGYLKQEGSHLHHHPHTARHRDLQYLYTDSESREFRNNVASAFTDGQYVILKKGDKLTEQREAKEIEEGRIHTG